MCFGCLEVNFMCVRAQIAVCMTISLGLDAWPMGPLSIGGGTEVTKI